MSFKIRGEEVNPKDIIGIEPTELTDKLGKVDTLSTDFGSFKTATETGISEIKQALAALAGGGQQKQQQQQQQQQQEEQFDANDPIQVANRNSIIAQTTALNAQIATVKLSLRERMNSTGEFEYPYWDQLLGDMEELTKNDQLGPYKASEQYWINAYSIVLGRWYSAGKLDKVKPRKRFFTEGGTSAGASAANTNEDPLKPTAIDEAQAKKFGLPIDKYMASKQNLNFVGGGR